MSHETRFVVGVVEVHVDGSGHVVHCQQHDEHDSDHFGNGLMDYLDRVSMKYTYFMQGVSKTTLMEIIT